MTPAEAAAAAADLGSPTARKGGRNPRWPYVPVIVRPTDNGTYTEQIRGLAYGTRAEAVAAAAAHLDAERRRLAEKLAEPRMRALREQYGLPRELAR